jgi:tRNA nucleotidyltransferase (CCA-adding enzyme)
MKIGQRFRKALPPATHELLRAIGTLSRDSGYRAYLVGGIVRDLMLGRENVDLDIAIEGDAERLARTFARKTGSRMRAPTRFGTCKIESKAFGTLDIAATRGESYKTSGALPDVAPEMISEDLERRDFSINAMALSLNPGSYGRLLDPLKGSRDVADGKIRVLHPASFSDDPTRLLRGIRFAARYGFTFERDTLRLFRDAVGGGYLNRISGKRVYTELKLLCKESEAARALMLLRRHRVLETIDPAFGWTNMKLKHARLLGKALATFDNTGPGDGLDEWQTWFAVFFTGIGRRKCNRLLKRLNLPRDLRKVCVWAAAEIQRTLAKLERLDSTHAYKATRLLRSVTPEGLVHLYIAGSRRERILILKYVGDWVHVRPALTGGQIVDLGVAKGPRVGAMLEAILRLKLSGKIRTKADEVDYVKSRLS